MLLKPDDHILFYGDSITDCGRDKSMDGKELGRGYVRIVASLLGARHAEWNLRFTNTGISGNRLCDLEDRMQADLLDRKPTVVSFLIGINDTWRRYDSGTVSDIDAYAQRFERMLTRITSDCTDRLVLIEPFVLPVPADRARWREDLDPRIAVTRDVARRFSAVYVPMDGLFAAAATRAPMEYWLPDGVHPTEAGHGLIADAWIRAVARA